MKINIYFLLTCLLAGCCSCSCPQTAVDISGRWKINDTNNTLALYDSTTGKQVGEIKMAHNKNYCRPTSNGKSLEFAPVILPPNPGAPTEAEYNAAGWYRNGVESPNPPEGKIVGDVIYRYDAEENAVVADYTYIDIPPPTLEDYDAAMEQFLREEREARGYTTREPDSYLTSEVPRWAQDARDWVSHRDAVMEYALELINAVERGERPPPTMEEFLANMPQIQWTYTGQ